MQLQTTTSSHNDVLDDGCGRWLRTLHGQEVKCQGTEPLQNQQRDIIKSVLLKCCQRIIKPFLCYLQNFFFSLHFITSFFVGKTQRDFDRFLRKFRHKQSAQCNWGLSFNLIMTSNEPQRRNLEQARRFDSSVIICLKSITIIGRRLWL